MRVVFRLWERWRQRLMLRGVQGLAPARGRRRNACAGNIVTPHSLIQRWLALLYYLYYLRLAALYKTVWSDYNKNA